MKTRLLAAILFLTSGSVAFAQPWARSLKTEGPVSFYELKAAYDQYFETHEKVRGSGSKQFERYAWFMEPRVHPSGYLPENALWDAWQKKQEARKLKTGGPVADWTPMGPFDTPLDYGGSARAGSGRINCIAFHPSDPQIMYVGAPSGGVWKTSDGGASWETKTDFLPALGVSDLAIHPDHPEILYMVTGDKDGGNTCPTYSYGILKSTDAGETWQATGLVHETPQTIRMRRLVILTGEQEVLLAGGSSGLFRSLDGGDSWNQLASGNYFDLEVKPGDPSTVYACTNQAIFKSTDAGASFVRLENGLPTSGVGRIEMAVTQANPAVVYAVMSNSESGYKALYKSSDSGASFTTQSTEDQINIFAYATSGTGDKSGIAWYAIALAVDQENENIVYSGSVNLWKSTNGGQNWTISAHWYGDQGLPYVHADEHTLAVNPLTNVCFSGNDGGFYKTTDKGDTWSDLSDGLSILQIYRMGASATNPERILEGSQDNGTYLYHDQQWHRVMGGDGMECAIDPKNEFIMYASYQNGALHRSVNMGGFTSIRPSDKGSWITPFDISRLSPNVLVAGYEAVYLSVNRGDSWQKISGELAGGSSMNELTLAPSDDRYIYVSQGSNLWMTSDRGTNWENISGSLPDLSIECITVAQSEPLKVWVCFSGYSDGEKVFFSDDGGQSWTNLSAGLPNVPANCLTYKNNSNYSLYAGTDLGVYYRTTGLSEWLPFDDKLPNVIVNEMEINDKVNKIRAATFGRGLWESPIVEEGNWPPAIQLTAQAGNGSIRLDWMAAQDRTPDQYQIIRNGVEHATSESNTYTDEVANGIVYEYVVKAVYSDGVSTPTNAVTTRGEEPVELPYSQSFDTEAHGWLIQNKVNGWQWGTGAELALTLLGESQMIAINSTEASKQDKHAEGYAVLPKMNLAGKQDLEIRFDYAMRRWQDLDHLYLVYRTTDHPEWTTLLELEPSGRLWRWLEFSMDVPQEVFADEIEFAFYYTDSKDIGYGAAVDNFYLGPKTSGMDLTTSDQGVKVYPNPAEDQITLDIKGFVSQKLTIKISDLTGRLVFFREVQPGGIQHQERISLEQLPTGLYQLQLVSPDKTWIQRISLR